MLVETREDFDCVMAWIKPGERTYIDLETTGFDPHTEKLVMITVAQVHDGEPQVFVIDARKPLPTTFIHYLRHIIKTSELVGHNLAFDLGWLYHHFYTWPSKVWDTMIVQQVIQGRGLSSAKHDGISFGLKQLAHDYCHVEMDKETRDYFIGLDHRLGEAGRAWDEPFPDDAVEYAALDVAVLDEIYWGQRYVYDMAEFDNDQYKNMAKCIDLENRAVVPFAHMKYTGMPINAGEWQDVIADKAKEAKELEAKAFGMALTPVLNARDEEFARLNEPYLAWEKEMLAFRETLVPGNIKEPMAEWKKEHPKPVKPKLDHELNLGSPTQLMELFNILGIKVKNTQKETLKRIADEHPIAKAIVDWREAEKFVTSFGDAVLDNLNPVTHRIHPDWNQIGADTGRVSCSKPNLQQIPSRTATGKKLRHAVQAEDGWVFLDADFSSQELVILAYLSGEPAMISAFENGVDLHAQTAILMFNLDGTTDTRTYQFQGLAVRDIAKQINYGIAYGMTKYRLGKLLKIGYDEAQTLIDMWYSAYPVAKRWLDARKQQVFKGQWYSETLHGWVRSYHPLSPEPVKPRYGQGDWRTWKEAHRSWEEELNELQNQMMNSPIQGTGAGVAKLSLTLFFERAIMDNGYSIQATAKPRIVVAVHDENLVECRIEDADIYAPLLGSCMDEAMATYIIDMKFPKSEVTVSEYWQH